MIVRSVESIITMLDADYMENDDIRKRIRGVSIDSRKVVAGNLYIPIKGDRHNGHHYIQEAIANGALATLWNRDEPNPPRMITVILVEDTTAALQKLAAAYREQLSMRVIGITGSNGKTSTKDILAGMLSEKWRTQKTLGNFNNEIGVPLTLLAMSEATQIAVVEMGMENRGELAFLSRMVKPDIAIITNVGMAHLENLGSLANIADAKAEISEGLAAQGMLIYNGDQPLLRDAITRKAINGHVRIKTFGEAEHNDMRLTYVSQSSSGITFSVNDEKQRFTMNLLGRHQAVNATAALLCAREWEMNDEEIQLGLTRIEKTGMRNELMPAGRAWILNDAYKSNPQSCIAALDTLAIFDVPYKIAVLSDMLDLGEQSDMIHFQLGKKLAEYDLDEVLTCGTLGAFITQGALQECDQNVRVCHFESKAQLIDYLKPYRKKACIMLIKGSHAMRMDEIVAAIGDVDHQ